MMPTFPLLLAVLATPPAGTPSAAPPSMNELVAQAIAAAVVGPQYESRVEAVAEVRPGCQIQAAEPLRLVQRTGSFNVHLLGVDSQGEFCARWTRARVSVHAPALRVIRPLAAGERIAGATEVTMMQVLEDAPAQPGPNTTATRALPAGRILVASDVRAAGPNVGQAVDVVLTHGGIHLSAAGRVVPCSRIEGANATCAVLENGAHVAGRMMDAAQLLVGDPGGA